MLSQIPVACPRAPPICFGPTYALFSQWGFSHLFSIKGLGHSYNSKCRLSPHVSYILHLQRVPRPHFNRQPMPAFARPLVGAFHRVIEATLSFEKRVHSNVVFCRVGYFLSDIKFGTEFAEPTSKGMEVVQKSQTSTGYGYQRHTLYPGTGTKLFQNLQNCLERI